MVYARGPLNRRLSNGDSHIKRSCAARSTKTHECPHSHLFSTIHYAMDIDDARAVGFLRCTHRAGRAKRLGRRNLEWAFSFGSRLSVLGNQLLVPHRTPYPPLVALCKNPRSPSHPATRSMWLRRHCIQGIQIRPPLPRLSALGRRILARRRLLCRTHESRHPINPDRRGSCSSVSASISLTIQTGDLISARPQNAAQCRSHFLSRPLTPVSANGPSHLD